MKAMVLAAGMGTRLRPLTDHRPKALVTIAGRTLLEIALCRLRTFGVTDAVVNVHHHAEMIIDYLAAHENFGMRIVISHEDRLLDTGGGLKRTEKFFVGDGSRLEEPFILHNVDVVSTVDLGSMTEFHRRNCALATLAVQKRETSRHLLFDENGWLCGRQTAADGKLHLVRPAIRADALGFCGIHVISPSLFLKVKQEGEFSIIDTYLQLAERNDTILSYRADEVYWRDLGRPGDLQLAEQDVESGKLALT